ncbi:MAG: hypothetical protein HDT46_04655 [Ruminococcaceae bacterium]|nr:hypothetical protein [Oscillospiraceae bacterium]
MNSSMEKMIELASKKLGISSEKLKRSLETGNVDDMLGNMRKEDADKLKRVMDNPSVKEKLLNSPEAANIIKKMNE